MLCRRQSAPSPRAPAHARLLTLCANVRLQGLELLVTVLLTRDRPPLPTVAAGVPRAELAAELLSLPSGLLAMVCEAIVKLKVRLGGCRACVHACVRACVRACVHAFRLRGPSERGRRGPGACEAHGRVLRAVLSSRVGPADGVRSAGSTAWSTGLGTAQVSDVVRAVPASQRTGPLRRSSRLSTLRARASA
jgi:hypothetical protein